MRSVKKVTRFIRIYGFGKTLFKVVGRARAGLKILSLFSISKKREIGVIGCGQFSFATIGYSLKKKIGNRFAACFDVDDNASQSFADFYGIPSASTRAEDIFSDQAIKYVYIVSNHASHTDYAISALNAGKVVYVEKPIAVSMEQLTKLHSISKADDTVIYAGYNRPFSKAVMDLKKYAPISDEPISMNCFISGHMIPADHWYRNPEEGTRVCGNIGHWLDLMVHILSWGSLPDEWAIQLAFSNPDARDDDLSITMTSSRGDLVVIVLTARCEPFEGINETINLQQGETICKIDDFRRMSIWQDERLVNKRYWPKDVGHVAALMQPFEKMNQRKWDEVITSSLLMLHIMDMVKSATNESNFSFKQAWEKLEQKN